MKKIFLLFIFIFLIGCESTNVATEPSIDTIKSQIDKFNELFKSRLNSLQTKISDHNETINKLHEDIKYLREQNKLLNNKISSLECNIESPFPYISDSKANCLLDKGSRTILNLSNGGENYEITNDNKILITDPMIDSQEKIINLLNESYAPKVSKEIFEMFGFEIIDGQLFKQMSDLAVPGWGGQFAIIDRVLKEGEGILTYKRAETEFRVDFIYYDSLGWRINTKIW